MSTPADNALDQAQPQSMADRIAAQFGIVEDEPPGDDGAPIEAAAEEAEAPEAPPEETEVEIEYEGARYRVPKGLEKAVLQEADYTRKAQEVAAERRQIEYERKVAEAEREDSRFAREVQTELQKLSGLEHELDKLKAVDIREMPMDEGFQHWVRVNELKEQRETLQKQIEGKRAEFSQKQRQNLETFKTQARELLSKQYGGLDEKAFAELSEHVKTYGYSEQDIDMMSADPRALSMAYKAMRFEQLQASKAGAVQKVTAAPAVKPGSSNPMPQAVRDKLALRKAIKAETNSAKRAKLIEQDIASRFS